MSKNQKIIDVLCVGAATYDSVYSVDHHPHTDEKIRAEAFTGCGGGPAANAAVTVARLGLQSALVGYLGSDIFGKSHIEELQKYGVNTDLVARGSYHSAQSVVIVKPDGSRALVSYRKPESVLHAGSMDFSPVGAKVVLFDGHEPDISPPLAIYAREKGMTSILDAGSVHRGTEELKGLVDYLVCSEKFAHDFTGESKAEMSLAKLASYAPNIIITLGERGLAWKNPGASGRLDAFRVNAVDTTGAGDVFHGAFAACLAEDRPWLESLTFASAAAALCCTKTGARLGVPERAEVKEFLSNR